MALRPPLVFFEVLVCNYDSFLFVYVANTVELGKLEPLGKHFMDFLLGDHNLARVYPFKVDERG